jgi:hypothetical protein
MIKKRVVFLTVFILLSNALMVVVAGQGHGSSGPIIGFYSWAFLISRISEGYIPIVLIVHFIYFLLLLALNTLMALLKRTWGSMVPILIHCLGVIVVALSSGPLLIDEQAGTFVFYLALTCSLTLGYILVDWRLAIGGREH